MDNKPGGGMHHLEIEHGEAMAREMERALREPMETAYEDVVHGPVGRVKDEAYCETVNHPAHYTQGKIECIEVLEQLAEQGVDFRVLHAIRYLWRYQHKGGAESLRKAIWYIDRVLNNG